MSAPELRLLSFGKSILLVSGARPFLIEKVQHYRDQPLKALLEHFGDVGVSAPLLGDWKDGGLGPILRSAQKTSEPVKVATINSPSNVEFIENEEGHSGLPEPESDGQKPAVSPIVGLKPSDPPQIPRPTKTVMAKKRRLKTAPPVPGSIRDYPASAIVSAARSESDSALEQLTETLKGASSVSKMASWLVELHASFGETDAASAPEER